MPRRLPFTAFLILSLALHALVLAGAALLIKPAPPGSPFATPVRIVDLPREDAGRLPPLGRPAPPRPIPPERRVPDRTAPELPLPAVDVPAPDKFSGSDDAALPTAEAPGGDDQAQVTEKPQIPLPDRKTGPLPFLTQRDIDELARKGMPKKKPDDDSITLDTDESMFISYNRWLKIKVEKVLKYPDLAAVSGYQGMLYLSFDILKDGSLGGVEILKSSGYKILDDEAVRAIRDSAPFQPLPDAWRMERYSIRAAVLFYLGAGYIR